jgi:hypothetical protein
VLDFKCQVHSRVKEPIATELKEDKSWKVKMLYDGDCPLFMHEVCLLYLYFLYANVASSIAETNIFTSSFQN